MTDLCYEPAHALAKMLRERAVSSADLLRQFEARMEMCNPGVNAIVATNFEAARERARQADAAIGRGEWWGPLHGLPMTIKDTYEVAGLPTVCGAPALKDYRPKTTALAVQRLLDAGAVVFGKTNVPLYAGDIQTFNKVYGTTRNPWNLDRTPGGSSGGAAAALAAGLTPLELGSDLAGSIRTPAHFCGVFGHKPSYGIIPMRGHIPGPPGTASEPDLCVSGPLARTAEDLELALRIVSGPAAPAATGWKLDLPAPRPAKLSDYRVHAWLDDPYCPVDKGVGTQLEAALAKLANAGCRITTGAPAGLSLGDLYELYSALLGGLFAAGLPPKVYRRARLAGLVGHWLGRDKPNTMAAFLRNATQSHREWLKAHEFRERLRLKLEQFFADVEVLLTPVTATTAPPHNQQREAYSRTITVNGAPAPYASQFTWISPATLAGLPATSAPVGLDSGLPVGLQVIGAHARDLTTIDFARQLAGLCGSGSLRPPEPGEPRSQAPAR